MDSARAHVWCGHVAQSTETNFFLSARHPAKALPVDGQKTLRLRRTANPVPVYEAFGYPPALLAFRISCTDRNCRQRKYNNYMSTNAKLSKSNTFLSLSFLTPHFSLSHALLSFLSLSVTLPPTHPFPPLFRLYMIISF